MFWIILIIGVVAWLIFWGVKDSNADIKSHVTNYGGMQEKYSVLTEYLMGHPSTRITNLSRDNITIASSSAVYSIDYVAGGNVEISLKAFLPLLGNISKKWKYPSSYSQELIIQEIDNFLAWNLEQMQRVASKMSDNMID